MGRESKRNPGEYFPATELSACGMNLTDPLSAMGLRVRFQRLNRCLKSLISLVRVEEIDFNGLKKRMEDEKIEGE